MDRSVRCLAWICLLLVLWPNLAISATSSVGGGPNSQVVAAATTLPAVPVVTNIAGTVGIRTANGASRDIVSSQILHSGDLLMTGMDSLAVVNYADAGRVRLGPATSTTASLSGGNLLFHVASGSLCIEGQRPAIKVESGSVSMVASSDTIFNVLKAGKTTKLAVFRGQVTASVHGKDSRVLKLGEAAVSPSDDALNSVAIDTLMPGFAPLKCPDTTTIARAVPSPVPTPVTAAQPSGGGGGGGGIIGILLGLAALGALAGGHGGGGGGGGGGPGPQPSFAPPSASPSPTAGSVVLTPSTLSFSDVGGDSAKTFTVSEPNYSGDFTVDASNCTGGGTATVTPTSGSSNTTFTVTPQSGGSCTVTVSGSPGKSAPLTVNVGPFGTVTPSSATLTFGDTLPQTFTVSEQGYTGAFSVDASQCAGTATVSPHSGDASTVFTVTPDDEGPSPCNLVVSDDHGQSATIVVNVGPFGLIQASPDPLGLSIASGSGTFTVSEPNYTGSFAIDPGSCNGTVTVTPQSGNASTAFTVTPITPGNCRLGITDDFGKTGGITINVTIFLTVQPGVISFSTASDPPQTFVAASQNGDGVRISATSSDESVAHVSPHSRHAFGPITFTVTPNGNGRAVITISDDGGGKAFVNVGVGTSPVSKSHRGITLRKPLPAFRKHPVLSPVATAPDHHSAIARSALSAPHTLPSTPPGGGAPNAKFAVGPLSVSLRNIVAKAASAPQTIIVSEANYNGRLQAVSSNAGVAAVAQSTELGPFVTLTIQPRNAGAAQITVTDDHGGRLTITVNVLAPPPLRPQPQPRPGGGPARPL